MRRSPLATVAAFAVVFTAGVRPPLASAEDKPLAKIVFGSCADQDKPCPIWQAILDSKPDLFVSLGDTIYADLDKSKKVTPELIQSKYDTLNKVESFAKLRAAVPMIGMYDDHDYGKNDGDVTWALKDEAQRLMLDFYKVPADSPRRTRKGVYHAETYGPTGKRVQVILLDGRYHRTAIKKDKFDPKTRIAPYIPTTDPSATLLGEEQWKWLEEQLKQPADLRLLASGIQVLSEDHPFEKWMNYPLERERLFKLLRETQANGVVVLSGDRHLAELSVSVNAIGYPLYDLTSSGFNQANPSWRGPEKNRHRVAAMPYGNNFGVVTVDWAAEGGPKVGLQLRDEEGEIVARQVFRLGVLKPNPQAAAAPAVAAPAGVLTPAAAAKKVGDEVVIQFEVKSSGASGTRLFLNSSADRNAEDNFTVVLTGKALTEGPHKGLKPDAFKGKTVRVSGKVALFRERPQIVVEDGAKAEVVEK